MKVYKKLMNKTPLTPGVSSPIGEGGGKVYKK